MPPPPTPPPPPFTLGLIGLNNKLRLNEMFMLSFLKFYCKINRNQLEIVVKATYSLHSNKYFEILNLTFWGKSLVARRLGLHSNSRGVDEIKGLPISIDFCDRNTDLLLLFSIISPWCYWLFLNSYTLLSNAKYIALNKSSYNLIQ